MAKQIDLSIKEDLAWDDALRLSVLDSRFAAAFLKEPEKFSPIFNLGKDEINAVRQIGGVIGPIGPGTNLVYE